MAWMRWEWNFINLAGLLLCVGTGVDYSIHVLLRMRANGGDIAEMQRTTGRGLMLCAASTVIGFGSLAWAGNKGLASMGLVCSAAILCSFLLNLFLLPYLAPKVATKPEA
jgi:predicted RND superfamily exporter protein